MKRLKNKKGLRMIIFLGVIIVCLLSMNNSNSDKTNNRHHNYKNEQNSVNIRYKRAQNKVKEAAILEKEEAKSENKEAMSEKEEAVSVNKEAISEDEKAISNKEAMSANKSGQKAVELIRMTGSIQDVRKHLNQYSAQTVLETAGVSSTELDQLFYSQDITDGIKLRIKGKSYRENCNVPYDELRYIRLLYLGIDQKSHIGELIVNKSIAEDIIAIFKELYAARYPIEKMVLVDEYDADDITSMEADNSSAFNFRFIDSTTKISVHSYGLAIDINPRYNPYIRQMGGKTVILPANGSDFADRSKDCEYYIRRGDICYQAFIKRGFTWGGDWKHEKDYQHFQKN